MDYIIGTADTQHQSPNKFTGRDGQLIEAVVVHKAEGAAESTMTYLADPATQKSYHYIIDMIGKVFNLVPMADTAWHAGIVDRPTWPQIIPNKNPNLYTVGVSLAGFAAEKHTPQQFDALVRLIADILDLNGLDANEDTIVFHREINGGKVCPGFLLDKNRIIIAVKGLQIAMKANV